MIIQQWLDDDIKLMVQRDDNIVTVGKYLGLIDKSTNDLATPRDMAKAIQRVRELHKLEVHSGNNYCEHCRQGIDTVESVVYPCPTIKVLDGEQ